MAQDIEEFLRMAAARKKQQAQQAAQPPAAAQPAAPPQQPASQPRQQQRRPAQAKAQPRPSSQREPDIYIGDDAQSTQTHPNLVSNIRPTVSTQDIAEHAEHLGDDVYGRYEAGESRVHQKFDHDLGSLQKKDIHEPQVVDHGRGIENQPDLSFVKKMLLNPASAKQAFVLKEIFDRPNF